MMNIFESQSSVSAAIQTGGGGSEGAGQIKTQGPSCLEKGCTRYLASSSSD